MPSLELRTNVKLDDPSAFIKEFSQVRPAARPLSRPGTHCRTRSWV